jgi:hypothetical protein
MILSSFGKRRFILLSCLYRMKVYRKNKTHKNRRLKKKGGNPFGTGEQTKILSNLTSAINPDTPVNIVYAIIRRKFNEMNESPIKDECTSLCAQKLCSRRDSSVCNQAEDFIKRAKHIDTSNFCHNMLVGTQNKTCVPRIGIEDATLEECSCFKYRAMLSEFENIKNKVVRISNTNSEWADLAKKTENMFYVLNTNDAQSVNINLAERFRRQNATRKLF